MKNLKAVFWDLDGTIADTELNGHRIAYNLAFNDLSINWNWTEKIYCDLLHIGGGQNRLSFYSTKMEIELSDNEIDNIYKCKNNHYMKLINQGKINSRVGALRLINQLFANNISQWLVTTSSKETAIHLVSSYFKNSINPFQGYICGEDVTIHKPNPEAYKIALAKSKYSPKNVIVIEDSLIGLKAAKNAGLKCILTLSPWDKNMKLEYKYASLVVDQLGDLNNKSTCIYGHSTENMVTYNSLKEALNST